MAAVASTALRTGGQRRDFAPTKPTVLIVFALVALATAFARGSFLVRRPGFPSRSCRTPSTRGSHMCRTPSTCPQGLPLIPSPSVRGIRCAAHTWRPDHTLRVNTNPCASCWKKTNEGQALLHVKNMQCEVPSFFRREYRGEQAYATLLR